MTGNLDTWDTETFERKNCFEKMCVRLFVRSFVRQRSRRHEPSVKLKRFDESSWNVWTSSLEFRRRRTRTHSRTHAQNLPPSLHQLNSSAHLLWLFTTFWGNFFLQFLCNLFQCGFSHTYNQILSSWLSRSPDAISINHLLINCL